MILVCVVSGYSKVVLQANRPVAFFWKEEQLI